MNSDRLEGKWLQLKGVVKEIWGKLTHDDIDEIRGRRERLAGRLQELSGIAREMAEHQIRNFMKQSERAEAASRRQRI
jgi:uncharacterized protein YjbJ (UPF0337 family)